VGSETEFECAPLRICCGQNPALPLCVRLSEEQSEEQSYSMERCQHQAVYMLGLQGEKPQPKVTVEAPPIAVVKDETDDCAGSNTRF